jgi:hypothetical protein
MKKLLLLLVIVAFVSCQNSGNGPDNPSDSTKSEASQNPESNQRDPEVVGTWMHESVSSLGSSGDQTFIQKQELMTFGEDGSLTYGGSKTSVGGNMSDYSEESGSEIPDVVWHTEDNSIYLTAKDKSGKQETAKMGTYYIENGKMLVTSDNGTKLVFVKQ